MEFKLVDASIGSNCTYVDTPGRRGRLWPVYDTSELLMMRAEIDDKHWSFSPSEFTYFFFVESGRVALGLGEKELIVEARQAFEVPEGQRFKLLNRFEVGPSYLVLVAGKEVLPGSFFNSFSSAYLNT